MCQYSISQQFLFVKSFSKIFLRHFQHFPLSKLILIRCQLFCNLLKFCFLFRTPLFPAEFML